MNLHNMSIRSINLCLGRLVCLGSGLGYLFSQHVKHVERNDNQKYIDRDYIFDSTVSFESLNGVLRLFDGVLKKPTWFRRNWLKVTPRQVKFTSRHFITKAILNQKSKKYKKSAMIFIIFIISDFSIFLDFTFLNFY